jgi:cyclin C
MSGASARTRSSTQISSVANSLETNTALGLPPPPTSPAEFLASFEVSLPTLFACVQDIICLYPVWEAFEPTPQRASVNGSASAAAAAAAAAAGNQPPKPAGIKFGPEDAEALVRRMIEEHMVDVGHPDNAGKSTPEAARKRTR